uniref:Uncharacterized protein n=1 Tax=Trypanosoma congolense (strain IL3000) TaxID=1068625 RepID=G0UV71_TRYCI|nr:conserved hypothetical protein [Trypanosoma congolense IL3000]
MSILVFHIFVTNVVICTNFYNVRLLVLFPHTLDFIFSRCPSGFLLFYPKDYHSFCVLSRIYVFMYFFPFFFFAATLTFTFTNFVCNSLEQHIEGSPATVRKRVAGNVMISATQDPMEESQTKNVGDTGSAPRVGAPMLAECTVTFYFSVFPCNCPPIFCSNRIAALRTAPPHCPGNVVYLGPAAEVAQQKLQELAFPRGFGCKTADLQNGPLFNACFEQVRKRGVLRYHRIKVASTFVALVVSENGELRAMQAKHTAVALVITCPPNAVHYDTLLQNFDSVVRYALHVSLDFAMWATQRFFLNLSRTTTAKDLVTDLEQHDRALETYNVVGSILVNALTFTAAVPRFHRSIQGIPHAHLSRHVQQSFPAFPAAASSPPQCQVGTSASDADVMVYDALYKLRNFNEAFTSRVVAGLLSVSNWEGYGIFHNTSGGNGVSIGEEKLQHNPPHRRGQIGRTSESTDVDDVYRDYWRQMEESERRQREGDSVSSVCNAGVEMSSGLIEHHGDGSDLWKLEGGGGRELSSPLSSAQEYISNPVGAGAETAGPEVAACPLSSCRVGRVAIFCTNTHVAKLLMILAAFFMRDRRVVTSAESPDLSPFAGCVESCAHSSLPVQWLREEYNRRRFERLLCSPYTVENVVLIIAPRSLVCQRLRLQKTFSVGPILVERFGERHQVVHPFRKRLLSSLKVLPDAVITNAVRTACRLQRPGELSSSCTRFLEWFVVWLIGRCHAIRCCNEVKKEDPTVESFSLFQLDDAPHDANSAVRNNVRPLVSGRSNDLMTFIANTLPLRMFVKSGDRSMSEGSCSTLDDIFNGLNKDSQLLMFLPSDA